MSRAQKLVNYVLPSVISFLSIFVFTIVDGVFVGRGVGTDALGAVNIAFPYIMLFSAVTMCTTIGGLTITAIRKGRDDDEGAEEAFMHSLMLTVLVSVFFTVAGTFFVKSVTRLMGSNETFFDMVCDYIFWYSVFMVPCGLNMLFGGFVRNDGRPVLVSAANIISTSLNIFGDWLLVFPLHMGLKGAAIATGVSQTAAALILLPHFFGSKGKLRFSKTAYNGKLCRKIIIRGLPECISQFNAPLYTVFMNIVILRFLGDTAENAFSVLGYVASFSIAVFLGVAEGLQPLFGNCYGAGEKEDLLWYRSAGVIIGFAGSLVLGVMIILAGRPICLLYGLDDETMQLTLKAMPVFVSGFAIQSVTVILSSYLYSTTKTREAVTVNVFRSFIANTAVTFLLPVLIGPEAIWYALPFYEFLVLILAVAVTLRSDKRGVIGTSRE